MMKKSHILIGAVSAVAMNGWQDVSLLALSLAGAFLGSILPDFDLRLGIKHRTITHWLIWPVLVYLFLPGAFYRALVLGWVLHILADCLTVEGLAPLWPIRWRVRGFVTTGGALESALIGGAFLALGFFLLRGNDAFQNLLSHLGNLVY